MTPFAHCRSGPAHVVDHVRDLSHDLHPATLEHVGLIPALRTLLRRFRSAESSSTSASARMERSRRFPAMSPCACIASCRKDCETSPITPGSEMPACR